MDQRQEPAQGRRARGAIAAKLAIVVAIGAGVLWGAPLTRSPKESAPGAANAPDATTATPGLPLITTAPQAAPQKEGDPFAGVDVGSSPVLRYINGIVEPKHAEPAAEAQATTAPVRVATAPRATASDARRAPLATQPSAPVTEATSLPPGSSERMTRVEGNARPNDAVPPAPASTAPAANPQAAATAAPTRPLPDAPAKLAAELDPRVSGTQPAAPAPGVAAGAAPTQAAGAPATTSPSADATRVALGLVDPAPAAPPAVVPPRATRRTAPVFPNEAIKAGIKTGRVLARVSIDADGRVTDSHILSARPPGYFERESQRALATWRYEAPGRSTSTEVELLFSRE